MNCFGLGVGVEIYEVVQNVKLYRSMRCALYIIHTYMYVCVRGTTVTVK